MKVDEATVRRIARLARIKVSDADAGKLVGELSGILTWVEQLQEVRTDGVEPMTCVVDMKMAMREDRVTEGGIAADVLANAPASDKGFFVVPKVVE
ncbi:MAG: Asp-tRNA(Asn)/Glu-tRNA(Gln) amidotransferase subunit GatC [Pseudomonadota bacterium]|nr:Asp-tRNA(Asn)/Glu-tRNA(Gln) amidotransferase subunit GatC [Pseudomonadota bacterium]